MALIPGNLRRPIMAIADKYPSRHHPDVARHANWLDTFGVDSEYNYDPFWAKAVELKIPLTTHSAGMGWTSRSSVTNYLYNHIGHFASASEALAKSLFFSGVTRRFPDLRVGFLEGGAAWGAPPDPSPIAAAPGGPPAGVPARPPPPAGHSTRPPPATAGRCPGGRSAAAR